MASPKSKLFLLSILIIASILMNGTVSTHAYTTCDGIEKGDRAIVDYSGTIQSTGVEFDANENSEFVIDSDRLVQGFYEGMLGMKIGEEKTIVVPPSKGYTDPETAPDGLYGETLIFVVKLNDIVGDIKECNNNGGGFVSTFLTAVGWIAGIGIVGFVGFSLYLSIQKTTSAKCAHCEAHGTSKAADGTCSKCGTPYCRPSFAKGCPNCGSNTFIPNDPRVND